MRRRHSAMAIALGGFLTVALLAVGAMITTPGIPGHALFAGAENVLRLSDPATRSVATVALPMVRRHHAGAKARKVTVSARAVSKHAARHTAAAKPVVRSEGNVGSPIANTRNVPAAATAPQAAAPAPAPAPVAAATPAPARSTPVVAKPAPVVAKAAKADIKVASADVGSDGNVHVTLAVAQTAGTTATAALPSQLAVNMKVGSLSHAAAAGPMALDTALDIVPDPSDPTGARLRMRMQLASQSSSAPAAPAEDPDSLSNVVTVRLNVPTPAPPRGHKPTPKPTPTPAPVDPAPTDPAPTDPAPADPTPVEVQLPIAAADPAGQTVQLPVPPAAAGGTTTTAPAVPVDVSVTPVDPAPAADPTATPTPAPTPTPTPAPADG